MVISSISAYLTRGNCFWAMVLIRSGGRMHGRARIIRKGVNLPLCGCQCGEAYACLLVLRSGIDSKRIH